MKAPLRNWCVVAIDPGTTPTICALWDRGESAKWYDTRHTGDYRRTTPGTELKNPTTPSMDKIRHILEYHNPDLVVIEKVWVRPGQGIVSSAKLVYCMGVCEGLARGLGVSLLSLFPQTWMKFHGLLTKDKGYHRTFAATLAPQHAWAFTRAKDHNRADSFLLASCGLQFLDRFYDAAVRKGAPLDHRPQFVCVR